MKQSLGFFLTLVGLLGFGQTSQGHSCQCPVCLGLPESRQQELRKEEEGEEEAQGDSELPA